MNLEFYKNNVVVLEKKIGKLVKEDEPIFSVVVPAYNLSEFIVETLESVFAQTLTNYEIVLVNDGSTDSIEFEAKLKPYFDKIIYLKQENAGAATARNTAILHSRGKYIAFLDGDDVWFPNYLKKQLEFIEKNGLELVYCNALFFGEKFYKVETYMEQSPSVGSVTAEKMLQAKISFITSGTVVSRERLLENGLFDRRFPRNEDYDLWFRLVKNGLKTDYQRDVLLKYRIRKGSLSGNVVDRIERILLAHQIFLEKYVLSESEKNSLAKSDLSLRHQLLIAEGKDCLVKKQFAEAKAKFRKANRICFKLKLFAIIFLLNVSPNTVLRFFHRMRSDEMTLMKS